MKLGRAVSRWLSPLVLLLAHGAGAASHPTGFANYHPAPLYTDRVSDTFFLSMRDGVRLAVRLSRPSRDGRPVDGRFPVIWTHALTIAEGAPTRNFGIESSYRDIPSLTAYGYVVAQVARRGNGESFGIRRGYNDRTEAYDAYEVTEWLAAQPWSTGAVGIYGCSNTGDASMHALTVAPPHLKAAFAGCFSWNKWDAFHRGGIYAQWGVGPQRTIDLDMQLEPVASDASRVLLRQAAEEHQQSTDLASLWHGMPYRDSWSTLVTSRFWYEGSISSYAEQLRRSGIALYIQGGWHDELRDQGLITLLNLPGSHILIGPWKHCQSPDFQLLQEIHRFFDSYLKGIATGLRTEQRIHYFTINAAAGTQWRSAGTWPVPGMRLQRLFLGGDGSLTSHVAEPARREFVVNTHVTCPNDNAGVAVQPCHVPGEGVSYTGDTLQQDLEVTGNAVVNLRLSTDRTDASLFAYLEDVAPDGSITDVTEGRLKASLRASAEAPYRLPGTPWHRGWLQDAQPLIPDEPATLTFDIMPTSYVFRAGHRLQLTVTGSDFRETLRDATAEGSRITLLSDPTQPSYLELPTIADNHNSTRDRS
jgi:putative CocE/NonD family hydrolase